LLEVIVFICGAALMGLEFLAARMLAPTLGSSLFVWGSVISIVMVALSLGYWLGGVIADRRGTTRTLAPVIAGAGAFAVLIPWLNGLVLPAVAGLGARGGSLAAAGAVFFAPSLLLAMVSPLGVRLAARTGVDHIGRSAGQLYAISTAGSIAGTIATAFWLIPVLSLDGLVVAIGFTLFATAALSCALPLVYAETPPMGDESYARTSGRGWLWLAAACIVFGAVVGIATVVRPLDDGANRLTGERELFRKDTQYHRLIVTENDEERVLRFDRSRQSAMSLDDPFETSFRYPNYFHLALAVQPEATRTLVVGLGGGSIVKRMWRDYPSMTIDAVEIDPIVVDVAEKYFEMPADPRVRVITEDGRRYLNSTQEMYDIIIMDAYYADSLPSHLTTVEFFEEVKSHLAPGGVLVYNVIGSVEGSRSRLVRSMYKTVGRVWENEWVFPIGYGTDRVADQNRNIIVLASDRELSRQELLSRVRSRVDGQVTVPGFESFGRDLLGEELPVGDVPLLTDQHAPTDSLIEVN